MSLLLKIVICLLLVSCTVEQNDNKDLPFPDMIKVIAAIMQNVDYNSTNVQEQVTELLKNNTAIEKILDNIKFQGKPPSVKMVKNLMDNLKNVNIDSLQKIISGSFDPLKLVSSIFLMPNNVSLACFADLNELVKPLISSMTAGGGNPLEMLGAPVVSMLDSWGKIGSGILIGNLKWIGAMDQCESFDNFRYCRSMFKFIGTFEGRWGVCFPKSCNPRDIDRILVNQVNSAFQGIVSMSEGQTMCNKPMEYNTGTVITIILLVLLLFAGIVGTVADILQNQAFRNYEVPDTEMKGLPSPSREDQIGITIDEKVNLKVASEEKINQPKSSTFTNVLICFSIPKNIKALLSTKQPKGAISCINGIRFISMTWVILGHYFFIGAITGSIDNITLMTYETRIFSFMPVANAYVAVDTFFLLSGLLVSYLTLKRIDKKGGMGIVEYLIYLLHRYLRLTPSLGILILVNTCLLPIIVKGPFSLNKKHAEINYESCSKYWWTNLLYINNFWPKATEDYTMSTSKVFNGNDRMLRLTPSLVILILANSCLLPLFLSGPFTIEVKYWDIAYKACQDYWWTNLLYISNFYPQGMAAQCVGWTWYLSNDWQFYVVSPGILLLFYYWEKKYSGSSKKYLGAFGVTGIFCLLSFIITMALIWKNDYPRLITAFFIQGNPRAAQSGKAQDNIYQKPYCRIPAYLAGLLLGYIFSRKIQITPHLKKVSNFMGWSSAIAVALAIIYGPWHVFRRENQSFMTDAENVFYGTFHRFAWSVAVAWVIYACHNKMGGWVNTFLSWKAFLPLSRLSYGAYLFHYLVLYYYFFISDRPNHIQLELVPFGFISSVVLSYGAAFLLSIFVEIPVANLEKYFLG